MLTYQQILDFYKVVHDRIREIDSSSEFKEMYSGYRYRVSNDGNEYSVIIPSKSFISNASFAILKEFDDGATELSLNKDEEGLSFLDGEMLSLKEVDVTLHEEAMTIDPVVTDTFFEYVLPQAEVFVTDAAPYEAEAFELQQKQKEKHALERLRHVKLEEKDVHFMAVFEYRLPDDSVYYVAFNKRGLMLARQQESFLPYPFYNRVGDLSKVYFIEKEKVLYNRSFRDQRYV